MTANITMINQIIFISILCFLGIINVYSQLLCDFKIMNKTPIKFYCEANFQHNSLSYSKKDATNELQYAAFVHWMEYPIQIFCNKDSINQLISHVADSFFLNQPFSEKYSAYSYSSQHQTLYYRNKKVSSSKPAEKEFILECYAFVSEDFLVLFYFYYSQGDGFKSNHQVILESFIPSHQKIIQDTLITFNIYSACPCLKVEQNVVDAFLKKNIIYLTNDCGFEDNYLSCPYLVIQDISLHPLDAKSFSDSLYQDLDKSIHAKIKIFESIESLSWNDKFKEGYRIQYKTVIIDRLKVKGYKQVEEWIVSTTKYKLRIAWHFPCNSGLENCFDENRLTFTLLSDLVKQITFK